MYRSARQKRNSRNSLTNFIITINISNTTVYTQFNVESGSGLPIGEFTSSRTALRQAPQQLTVPGGTNTLRQTAKQPTVPEGTNRKRARSESRREQRPRARPTGKREIEESREKRARRNPQTRESGITRLGGISRVNSTTKRAVSSNGRSLYCSGLGGIKIIAEITISGNITLKSGMKGLKP